MAQTLPTTFTTPALPLARPLRPRHFRIPGQTGTGSILNAAAQDLLQPRPQTIAALLKAARKS